MGYRRSAPTFTFMGVDRLNRTVDLSAETEERAAQIDGLRPRRPKGDGTLSVSLPNFVADMEDDRVEFVFVGSA